MSHKLKLHAEEWNQASLFVLKSETDKTVRNVVKLWVIYTRYFLLAAPHEKWGHPGTPSTRGQGPEESTLKEEVPLLVPMVPWL